MRKRVTQFCYITVACCHTGKTRTMMQISTKKTMGSKTDSLVAFQSQLHNEVKHLTQLHIVFSLMSNSDT